MRSAVFSLKQGQGRLGQRCMLHHPGHTVWHKWHSRGAPIIEFRAAQKRYQSSQKQLRGLINYVFCHSIMSIIHIWPYFIQLLPIFAHFFDRDNENHGNRIVRNDKFRLLNAVSRSGDWCDLSVSRFTERSFSMNSWLRQNVDINFQFLISFS